MESSGLFSWGQLEGNAAKIQLREKMWNFSLTADVFFSAKFAHFETVHVDIVT